MRLGKALGRWDKWVNRPLLYESRRARTSYKARTPAAKQKIVCPTLASQLCFDKMAEGQKQPWTAHWRLFAACGVMILSPFQYGIDFGMIGGLQAMVGFLRVGNMIF